MLNLSDKDLDRLSQEAAQHHEPGDIIGPRLWEKLELRLDRDLGKIAPNPARGIRRLPYFYAPIVLLILGVSYYLVKLNNKSHKGMSSASPPLTLIPPAASGDHNPSSTSQSPKQSNTANSTLTSPTNTVPYPATPGAAGARATSNAPVTPAGSAAASARSGAATADRATTNPGTTTSPAPTPIPGASTIPGATTKTSQQGANLSIASGRHRHRQNLSPSTGTSRLPSATASGSRLSSPTTSGATGQTNHDGLTDPNSFAPSRSTADVATPSDPRTSQNNTRELTLSRVRGPIRLSHATSIDDSALRAITANAIPRQPIVRKGGLHINRSLEFGLLGAPDFASVNSVAGNKAGSTFGLTVDYQFVNHWYIGTGLLFTRKNYAAAPENYHVPANYYVTNHMSDVQYITGRLDMLEIPLNLRYDFSTTGNTLFFATVGTSSYLLTSENCSYYYNSYGRPASKEFQYLKPDYLFSAINLSLGVETGISNSMSLLIAPYVKMPTRNIGFGQVQLNSFGIDFALKFAPVISRKR